MSHFEAHLQFLVQAPKDKFRMSSARNGAVEIAPLSMSARLHLSHCLEESLDINAAADELKRLRCLHMTLRALDLAIIVWHSSSLRLRHLKAAQLVISLSWSFLPGATSHHWHRNSNFSQTEPEFSCDDMSDEEIYSTLMQEQIPIAPTNEVSTIFLDGTRASLDAELF